MTGAKRAQAAQVSVVPERPSPREKHPRRESNEESPESGRLFGAVWGAAAVRLPHFAPADSPRETWQNQYDHAKTHSAAPPTPFSVPRVPFVLRRDRHKETRKPEVNQEIRITVSTIRERTTGDHDPRRNRNETYRKPFCLAHRRQTAGVIEHKTSR